MRRFAILLISLALAGCFTVGKRGGDAPLAIYDLGAAGDAPLAGPRSVPMAVEVRAPLWFDALGIDYRLAYAEPARLREYARARWAGPPAQLIQLRLSRELDLLPAGQGRAACVLRVEIEEFSQIFETPSVSRGVMRGRVQWFDRGRARLAERRIEIAKAAGSADAQGGVAALSATVGELAGAIAVWERELAAHGLLRGCQG